MLGDSPMPALFMGVSIMVLLSLSPDFTWGNTTCIPGSGSSDFLVSYLYLHLTYSMTYPDFKPEPDALKVSELRLWG